MGRLSKFNLGSWVVGKGSGAKVETDEGRALLGDTIKDLIGIDLGLVVVCENSMVDRLVELIPLASRPPRGTGTARAEVGDEEEAGDCWNRGSGVDEVDCCITVNLEGLRELLAAGP